MELQYLSGFFSDEPTVICSSNGKIVIRNATAEDVLGGRRMVDNIYALLSYADVVRYDVIMNCRKPRPFTAAANRLCGYNYVRLTPHDMSEYRICVATFSDKEEYISASDTDGRELEELAWSIAENKSFKNTSNEPYDHFDILAITKRLVQDLCRERKYFLRFSHSLVESIQPCSLSMRDYICLVSAVFSVINKMAGENEATVLLKKKGRCYELSVDVPLQKETEALTKNAPELELCTFIAEAGGCCLEYTEEPDAFHIRITTEETAVLPDFRSLGIFEGYKEIFAYALAMADIMEKLQTQQ